MMVFIDGENLVARFQETRKAAEPEKGLLRHRPDVYVWHPATVDASEHAILRATYYTSAIADDPTMETIEQEIRRLSFRGQGRHTGLPSQLTPWVRKRERRSRGSKAVDIQIAVDLLTHCHGNNLDTVYLVSGDGDFVPVIEAALRSGKQVHLAAFSNGLNHALLRAVDRFIPLDRVYFPAP